MSSAVRIVEPKRFGAGNPRDRLRTPIGIAQYSARHTSSLERPAWRSASTRSWKERSSRTTDRQLLACGLIAAIAILTVSHGILGNLKYGYEVLKLALGHLKNAHTILGHSDPRHPSLYRCKFERNYALVIELKRMSARDKNLRPPESRCSHEEGFAAGLVALRAQGLEPTDFAKGLAADVIAGKITPQDMEDTILAFYRKKYPVKERKRRNVKA